MNLQAQLYGFGKALASALKFGGETWVVTTACSSTTVALGLAQSAHRPGLLRHRARRRLGRAVRRERLRL